jgi:uncharacterized membrane protein SpoIIM required for sporulation
VSHWRVDIDRFLVTNQPVWDRLDRLTTQGLRKTSSLSAAELDELVRLYQRTATHLSYVRTYFTDTALTARLTALVGRAATLVYGTRPRSWRAIGRFFAVTFPAAVWQARRFVLASAALTLAPAIAAAVWISHSPKALNAAAPAALRQAYLSHDFANYYSAQPSAQFAAKVTTNNIQVAFLAFAGGILLCGLTAFILVTNGANVGFAAGLFAAAGQQGRFYGLILPHGLLELTSVVVAGGAGLKLGWTLIDPGDRTRATALTEEGRRAVTIVMGLVLTFLVAGTIEGFVTGSALPTWARVGLGVAVESVFVTYVVVCGRAAAARGLTGALGEEAGGWALPASVTQPTPPEADGQRRPSALASR